MKVLRIISAIYLSNFENIPIYCLVNADIKVQALASESSSFIIVLPSYRSLSVGYRERFASIYLLTFG